jgi:hypothetical protein
MAQHFEAFDRAEEMRPPSGRVFGWAMALPFVLIAFAPARHGGAIRWWAGGVAGALVLTALVRPAVLDPLSAAWTTLLRPARQATTIVAMGLLFFLVMTPAGFLRRMLVRDPLRLRRDPAAATYWQTRQPSPPAGMKNQF